MDWLGRDCRVATIRICFGRRRRSVHYAGAELGTGADPLAVLGRANAARFRVYAQGDDYHDLIKGKLKAIARWLVAQAAAT